MKVKDILAKLENLSPETEVTPSFIFGEEVDGSNMIGSAVCPNCKETIILANCETEKYYTYDGDKCIYHVCCECGEPIETIDLINGNRLLEE